MKAYFKGEFREIKDLSREQMEQLLEHQIKLSTDGLNAQRSLESVQGIKDRISELTTILNK